MFAIIIMIIVLISFVSIISFSIISFNHNLSINNDAMALDNELTIIKQTLISHAKPILSSTDYALPYGTDIPENGNHQLPSGLGIPLINKKGLSIQYCPYGVNDSTVKSESVTQNDGSSYNVKTTNINGVNYVTHSNPPVSLTGSPEIQGIIISKINNNEVLCDDILYNTNTGVFYSKEAKVSVITKNEISNYFRLNNLSGVQEEVSIDSSNFQDTIEMINNDLSNKEYNIIMDENITLTANYSIEREFNKKSNITINTGSYAFLGNYSLTFSNVNLLVKGTTSAPTTSSTYSRYILNDSDVSIDNTVIGGVEINSSNVKFSGSSVYSNLTQKTFKAYNSNFIFDGENKIFVNNSLTYNSILDLNSSNAMFNSGSNLTFTLMKNNPLHLIDLKNSNVKLYGKITQDVVSYNKNALKPIRINSKSNLYLNGAEIYLEGNPYSSGHSMIEVKGVLSSGGEYNNPAANRSYITINNNNNVSSLISVSNGGQLLLDNIYIGQKKDGTRGAYVSPMIKEEAFTYTINGASLLSGDNSVDVFHSSYNCWSGNSFENVDGLAKANSNVSSSDKINNVSAWECFN